MIAERLITGLCYTDAIANQHLSNSNPMFFLSKCNQDSLIKRVLQFELKALTTTIVLGGCIMLDKISLFWIDL